MESIFVHSLLSSEYTKAYSFHVDLNCSPDIESQYLLNNVKLRRGQHRLIIIKILYMAPKPHTPMLHTKTTLCYRSSIICLLAQEKKKLRDFTIFGLGAHFGQVTLNKI